MMKNTQISTQYIPIEGCSNYGINCAGQIINFTTGRIMTHSKNHRGYRYCNLIDNGGVKKMVRRHRLMGLLFLKKPDDFDPNYHQVNHINGIPGDDYLDNLEWVTPSENVQHSVDTGLRVVGKPNPFEIRDINTGEITCYRSIHVARDKLHLNKDQLTYRLLKSDGVYAFPHNGQFLQFKYISSTTPWRVNNPPIKKGIRRGVVVRWVECDGMLHFKTQRDAAKYLVISESWMHNLLKKFHQPIFLTKNNQFVQLKNDDDGEWRTPDDLFIEHERVSNGRFTLKLNPNTNKVLTAYQTAAEASKASGHLPGAMDWHMKYSQSPLDGFNYQYYSEYLKENKSLDLREYF